MSQTPLRLLILGAHPDDAEFHAGGLAARYAAAGHTVKMVSMTCGDAGHQTRRGPELAAIRRREAQAAAASIGAEGVTWDWPDGQLEPTLELRWQVIRELRTFRPDLVLTHRDNDYHPDHRAVGQVVRDASYLVTVPALVPDAPLLARDPVVAFMADRFTRPAPLRPDVVLDVSRQIDVIVGMLAAHASQFFEWLPFNRGVLEQMPTEPASQKLWLRTWFLAERAWVAERYAQPSVGGQVDRGDSLWEVYEISEYAAPLDAAARQRLFGWLA